MQIEIINSPGNAAAKVVLDGGEKLVAESGGMIAMSADVSVVTSSKTKGGGGFMKGIKRMLTGESFFLNTFTAPSQGGEVYLAPGLVGDMVIYELDGSRELIAQGTSFVGSGEDVELDSNWQGWKSAMFSGESMFWLHCKGSGPIILNSFGGIYEKEVDGSYIVDTGHIVAFETSLRFDVQKAGRSWFSALAGGEGLVCRFEGRGRLFCQTHNANNFGWSLSPMLRPRN